MTALDRFDRLESGGLWRDGRSADPREVTVSFGKTTLVLSEGSGQPLAHWSLPAVQRRNPGTRPAIFAPDDDASETVEIEDDLMVDAIEQVRKALIAAQPHPGRLRGLLTLGVLSLIVVGALIWAPAALTQKTLSVVTPATRADIGATVLGHYQRLTGTPCNNPLGRTALQKLHTRLIGPTSTGKLVVVQELPQGAAALPGGIILIDRTLIEQRDDPAIVAGYILAAVTAGEGNDPLETLLQDAGLQTTLSLFTTGELPDPVLQTYAQTLKDTATMAISPDRLASAIDAAAIPRSPYLEDSQVDVTWSAPMAETPRPILDDNDWVRLQGICDA